MSTRTDCPSWCRRHGCALGEHRAQPIRITLPVGTAVLTRIHTAAGTEHAEVRLSLVLPAGEPAARVRLLTLLAQLHTFTTGQTITTSGKEHRP